MNFFPVTLCHLPFVFQEFDVTLALGCDGHLDEAAQPFLIYMRYRKAACQSVTWRKKVIAPSADYLRTAVRNI